MYHVAICDDNIIDGQHILALAEEVMHDHKVDAVFSLFVNPHELLNDMKENNRKYDLLLLDILMGKTNGIQFARTLRSWGNQAALIYTTISRDYAIEGYQVQANDYLLKPIEKEALDASISRILKKNDMLFVEDDGMLKSILVSDIQYVEASANYVVLKATKHMECARLRATLSEIQNRLGKERFARCHKGYLVNLGQIWKIRTNHILLYSGDIVPLGRQYRPELQKKILEYVEKAIPQ